jgi:hypothetical protein
MSYWYLNAKQYRKELKILASVLVMYTRAEGSFPASTESLIKQGYLVRERQFDDWVYYAHISGRLDDLVSAPPATKPAQKAIHFKPEDMIEVPRFQDFKIKYSVGLEELRAERGKVLLRSTGEQVLLIDGPTEFVRRRFYEKLTYELYQAMKSVPDDG